MMSSKRIYIVEDSYLVATHIKHALEQENYIVTGIGDSTQKAIEDLQNFKSDVVLLDISLNGEMSGIELASIIKDRFEIPFIYITALSDKDSVSNAKTTQPYGYLLKPVDEKELIMSIELAIGRWDTQMKLQKEQRHLNSLLNNTSFMIWSVDRSYNVIMANTALEDFLFKTYNIKADEYKRVLSTRCVNPFFLQIQNSWWKRYDYAFTGKMLKTTIQQADYYFSITISPIVSNGEISGATVFAENVTDHVGINDGVKKSMEQLHQLRVMAFQSSMNSHFIYNVLNSIQFYIVKQDGAMAMASLSKFSKLIRAVMNHLGAERVLLSSEIDLLKVYLELEAMRFENRFEHVLTVSENISKYTLIPPFVIQPYLERCIQHSAANENDKSKLTISFDSTVDRLTVEISVTDYGKNAASLENLNADAISIINDYNQIPISQVHDITVDATHKKSNDACILSVTLSIKH
jgi:AmiR/NasT family two-component response regulator